MAGRKTPLDVPADEYSPAEKKRRPYVTEYDQGGGDGEIIRLSGRFEKPPNFPNPSEEETTFDDGKKRKNAGGGRGFVNPNSSGFKKGGMVKRGWGLARGGKK